MLNFYAAYLLSPFDGSPVTFFYELLSKDSKRARRLDRYAAAEMEYLEVSARFNDSVIKSVLPGISEVGLKAFKSACVPAIGQLKGWSDYDLFEYIKRSFEEFQKKGSEEE